MNSQTQWRYLKQGRYSINQNQILGEGSFGKVYKGYDYTNQKWVALKQIPLDKLSSSCGDQFKEILLGQISIMRKFSRKMIEKPCQFIVKQQDCFRTQKYIFIVMQICDQGTLEDQMRGKRLTEMQCTEILYCLATGLTYMSEMNIVHRDLKPQNIFITKGMIEGFEEKVYKIGDFGFASQKQQYEIAMGTLPYMAPQMLSKGKYTSMVDIWSLGVIAYEIIFRKIYFGGADQWEIKKNIKQKPFILSGEEKGKISENYQNFLIQCLDKDPQKRIKAEELLKHPIFQPVRQSLELMKLQSQYEEELKKNGIYQKNKASLSNSQGNQQKKQQKDTTIQQVRQNKGNSINVFDGLQALIFQCVKMRQMAEQFYYLSEQKGRQTQFMQIYLLKDAYVMMNKITYTVLHRQDYTGVLSTEQMEQLNKVENEQIVKVLQEHCSRQCEYVSGLFNQKYKWVKKSYMGKFEIGDQNLINEVVNQEPYEYINEQVFERQLNKWVKALQQYNDGQKWKDLYIECANMAALKSQNQ